MDNINAEAQYDYILFDCPPATKLVSQNALAASNFYVIPVIPDEMLSRGVTHFQNLVKVKIDDKLKFLKEASNLKGTEIPLNYVPTTKLAGIVPFLAKTAGNAYSGLTNLHTRQIRVLKNKWKEKFIDATVKHMVGVPEAIDSGWPVWDWDTKNVTPAVVEMMENVCQKIVTKIE